MNSSNAPARALKIDDFCREYGLSRTTTYKLIKEGLLTSVKVGGRRLIARDAAEALLINRKPA